MSTIMSALRRLFTRSNDTPAHQRINEREKEITQLMARKLAEEGATMLADSHRENDPDKQKAGLDMILKAQEVTGGEASLLSAMGLITHARN